MAVEKAIVFDDLMKGEEREGFFSGGQGRSRRGGMRGGRRGGMTGGGGRSRRGGAIGGRRAGASRPSAQNRAKAASKSQGQTRKGSTTTSKAVAKERAAIANVQGTKYSKRLSDAVRAANQRAFDKSLQGRKEAAAKAAIQASEAKQITSPTQSSIDAQIARMDKTRGSLLDKAKRNQITNAELSRLADMNRAIGLNPTTGMGLVESMRFNTKDVNLGDIAKLAGFVANPVSSVVSAALTGGQGILGTLKDAGQTALAGLTGQEAPKFGLGNLIDRFKNIDIGPAAPTPPDRGRRQDERMMAQMPPVPPIPAARPFDPRRIKKAVTPVGAAVTEDAMNEYLKLAGLA